MPWRWLAWASLVVVLDQASKLYADGQLAYGERWPVWPFFDFTLLYNTGAAFSFLAQEPGWQRGFFSVIAVGASGLMVFLLWRNTHQRLFCIALTAILGGAIGNLIDRLWHGYVVDFLLFYWQSWYFPAFNLADIAISCGAGVLILDELLRMRRARAAGNRGTP